MPHFRFPVRFPIVLFTLLMIPLLNEVRATEPKVLSPTTPQQAVEIFNTAILERDAEKLATVMSGDETTIQDTIEFISVYFKLADAGEKVLVLIHQHYGRQATIQFLQNRGLVDPLQQFAMKDPKITLSEDGQSATVESKNSHTKLIKRDNLWLIDVSDSQEELAQMKPMLKMLAMMHNVYSSVPEWIDEAKSYEQYNQILNKKMMEIAAEMDKQYPR